jgi:hypothetical protein
MRATDSIVTDEHGHEHEHVVRSRRTRTITTTTTIVFAGEDPRTIGRRRGE